MEKDQHNARQQDATAEQHPDKMNTVEEQRENTGNNPGAKESELEKDRQGSSHREGAYDKQSDDPGMTPGVVKEDEE